MLHRGGGQVAPPNSGESERGQPLQAASLECLAGEEMAGILPGEYPYIFPQILHVQCTIWQSLDYSNDVYTTFVVQQFNIIMYIHVAHIKICYKYMHMYTTHVLLPTVVSGEHA